MSRKAILAAVAAAAALSFAPAAFADINVGVSVSATGPAASLGIPDHDRRPEGQLHRP